MRRSRPLVLGAVLALTGGLAACSTTPVSTLATGQCFLDDGFETGTVVSRVTPVDCSENHNAEVVGIENLPEGDFPGREQLNRTGTEVCPVIFRDYTGQEWTDTDAELIPMLPDENGWSAGDRAVLCLATFAEPVTGSLRAG